MNSHSQNPHSYTLDELCQLADLSLRTARYYIQQGLLPGPDGKNRGARYSPAHLERLLEIKKWRDAGLSLERIATLAKAPDPQEVLAPRPAPGTLEVWSHLQISEGLQLQVEHGRSGLSSAQLRQFSREILTAYHTIIKKEDN